MKNSFLGQSDVHLREVVKGGLRSFSIRIVGVGLGFLANILVARNLDVNQAGIYFLSLSLVLFATVVGCLGLEYSVVKFIASCQSQGDWQGVKGVHIKALGLTVVASIFVSLLLVLLAPCLALHVFKLDTLILPLQMMAICVLPLSISRIYVATFRGLKVIAPAQFLDGPLQNLILILLLYPLINLWEVLGSVTAYLIATLISAVFGAFLFSQRFGSKFRNIQAIFPLKLLLESCLPLVWVTVSALLMNHLAVIFLGVWADPEDVAIFNICFRTSMLMTFFLYAAISILSPKMSELIALGETRVLENTIRKSILLVTGFAFPFLAVMVLFPKQIMSIFGDEFVVGADILVFLAIAQFLNVVTGPAGELLIMGGYERLVKKINISALLINAVLCVSLIQLYGAMGATISVGLTYMFYILTCVIYVKKKYGFYILPGFGNA